MSAPNATATAPTHSAASRQKNHEGHEFDLRPIECPTCGKENSRVLGLRGGRHHRYGFGVETRIVECLDCKLIYPNPFPYPVDAGSLYGDPEKYFARHDSDAKTDRNRIIIRQLQERISKTTHSILDVGSGRGEFLHAARLEGLTDVIGLELSQAMIDEAQKRYGVTVIQMLIEEYAATTSQTFDIIALNAVLEHVYNPNSMIASAARLMNPGGILYIDVPNEPSLLVMIGNAYSRVRTRNTVFNLSPTWPPYHVFGFNRAAINRLLTKHGFAVEDVRVHANPKVRSRGGIKDRMKSFVGTQVNRIANHTGTASNMYIVARKLSS